MWGAQSYRVVGTVRITKETPNNASESYRVVITRSELLRKRPAEILSLQTIFARGTSKACSEFVLTSSLAQILSLQTSDENRNNPKYWNMMFGIVFPHQATQRAFAEYCMNFQLRDWWEHDNKLKREMALSSLSPIQKFLINLTRDSYRIEGEEGEFTIRELHASYNDYIKNNGGFRISDIKLGKDLRAIADETDGLTYSLGRGRNYHYFIENQTLYNSLVPFT